VLRVNDIAFYIENELAPISEALHGDDNGLFYGSLENVVTGIAVCWSPTLKVLKEARERDFNLVVSHEWLFYHHSESRWIEKERKEDEKKPNVRRKEILSAGNMSVLKYHSNWDFATGGVMDSFGDYLGFTSCIGGNRFSRLYEIKPINLRDLGRAVLSRLGCRVVRISGDENKTVQRVLTAVGGLGQIFCVADDFQRFDPDAVIFGEILEYTGIYMEECDLPYLVTSHYHSEKPGMMKMARKLRERFSSLNVEHIESYDNWFIMSESKGDV